MAKITPDRLAAVYIKIRNKRSALKREFEAEDKKLRDEQDKISAAMLQTCKTMNVSSLKTDQGTIIKGRKEKYWTSDWDSFYQFLMENEAPELLTRSIHQSNLKQYLEENPDKFPQGLNIDAEDTISVRKPTKKAEE